MQNPSSSLATIDYRKDCNYSFFFLYFSLYFTKLATYSLALFSVCVLVFIVTVCSKNDTSYLTKPVHLTQNRIR